MNTSDILTSVAKLRERGLQFLQVPTAYYVDLKERLKHSKVKIQEDLDEVFNKYIYFLY